MKFRWGSSVDPCRNRQHNIKIHVQRMGFRCGSIPDPSRIHRHVIRNGSEPGSIPTPIYNTIGAQRNNSLCQDSRGVVLLSSQKKLRLRRAFRKISYFSKSQNNFVELSPPPLSGLAHVAVARRSKLPTHGLIRFLSEDGRAGCVKRKKKKGVRSA